jgi:hypothetical protein
MPHPQRWANARARQTLYLAPDGTPLWFALRDGGALVPTGAPFPAMS